MTDRIERLRKEIKSRALWSLNRDSDRSTFTKVETGLRVGMQLKDLAEKGWGAYQRRTTWFVTVRETDTAYQSVQAWLQDILPAKDHRNLTATTRTYRKKNLHTGSTIDELLEEYESPRNSGHTETRIVTTLDDTSKQPVHVDGHKVFVKVSDSANADDEEAAARRARSSMKSGKIVFECRSIEAQHAVVEMLNEMVADFSKRIPQLWISDRWGNWRSQDTVLRKMSSIVLENGIKEDVLDDLRTFLDDEEKYNELGIPWHRGYLFHGPAGTGKTSLIKALASELNLDLWYAPLGDLEEDSSLVDLIRSVRARGILLLEDVDAFAAARDRDTESKPSGNGNGISTSALLNALDGVVTPHGLITVMTTNHLDRLDPALTRSGRADKVVELGLPSRNELVGIWDLFFPGVPCDFEGGTDIPGISQAGASEVFKSNWHDAAAAAREIKARL